MTLAATCTVRIEWSDGEMEASWTLSPEDSETVLLAKLRRIIRFVESMTPTPPEPAAAAQALPRPVIPGPPELPESAITNGWALIGDDDDVA